MPLREVLEDGLRPEELALEAQTATESDFQDDPTALAAVSPEGAPEARSGPSPLGFNSTQFQRMRQENARAIAAKEKEARGFWDVAGAAIENEWVGSALERRGERMQFESFDPNYKLKKEVIEQLARTYSDRELEYLSASVSDRDYQDRLKDIEEDRERHKIIADAGGYGIAASLAAAIVDPTMLAAGFVSGPLATSSKSGRIMNALRSGGVVGLEGAAAEAVLTEFDTQKDWSDMYVAALGGFVLGGGIGALSRTKARAEDTNADKVASRIDDIDVVNKDFSDQWSFRQAQEVSLKIEGKEFKDALPVDHLQLYKQKLAYESNTGLMGAKELDKYHTRVPAMKQQLKDLETAKKAEIAEYWAKAGVNRGVARQMDEARVDEIVQRYDLQREEVQIQLDRLEAKMDKHTTALNAKLELEAMQSTTVDSQLKRMLKDAAKISTVRYPTKAEIAEVKAESIKFDKEFDAKWVPEPEAPKAEPGRDVGAAQTREEQLASRRVYVSNVVAEEEKDWIADAINSTYTHTRSNGTNWTRGIPDVMLSDYSRLDNSPSLEVRALNQVFNENSQGVANGYSVSVLRHVNNLKIRKAGKNAQDRGFARYLQEKDIGSVKGYVDPKIRRSFDEQVASAVKGLTPEDELPESVKIAVQGFRDQIWEAGRLRKEAGELGFEKLSRDANYYPDIMQAEAISDLVYNRGWLPEEVRELIARGYREGNNELTEKQARLMAWIKYDNVFNSQLYDGDVKAIFRANSAAEAERLLKDAKVPQDMIDAFFEEAMSKEDWASVSNRARESLNINWSTKYTNSEGDTISIAEVMNRNVGQVLEAYTNESAFGAALAEKGIRSEGQLRRIMYDMKKRALNDIAYGAEGEAARVGISDQFQILENSITQLKGKPLVDYASRGWGQVNRLGRALLDATAIVRLQQVGFASIPELARGITSAGLTEILRAVPGAGAFRIPGRIPRDPVSLRHMREDMAELEEMVGFLGEEDFNRTFSIRSDDFGSEANSRFMQKLDNTIEGTRRVSQWVSMHQTIQGGMEKIVARAVSRRLLKDAVGKRNMSRSMRDQIRLAGMTTERWKEISDWVKANPKTDSFNGRPIEVWNYAAMPKDMQKDMQVLLTRLNNRNVQKGLVGESNSMWLGPLGRFLTQFKTFSLVSLEKQFIADMRGDKAAMVANFMWGAGLAYAAYMAQMNLRALGMPEDKADEYLEKYTTGKNLVWGVVNKQSQLAAAGVVFDAGIMTGALPIEMFDANRYGYQTGRLDSMVPALGYANDVLKTGGAAANLGYDVFREDADMEESFKEFVNKGRKITPFTNTIFFGEYMKNITGLSEE